jgi:hypothetical protein
MSINSVTFEPDSDGTMICTSTYSVQQGGTSSDWGGSDPGTVIRVVRFSDSALLHTGPFQPATRTRMSQTYRTSFPVSASDGAVTVSLEGTGGAPGTSLTYWGIDLTVELIKR